MFVFLLIRTYVYICLCVFFLITLTWLHTHTFVMKSFMSRGGRAVTRLAFQAEDPGSIPGAGSHIAITYSRSSGLGYTVKQGFLH